MSTFPSILRWLVPLSQGLLFLALAACLGVSFWADQLNIPWLSQPSLPTRRGLVMVLLGVQLLAVLALVMDLREKARFPIRQDWSWWLAPAYPPGREEWVRVGISGFLWLAGLVVLLWELPTEEMFFASLTGWGGMAFGVVAVLSRSGLRLIHQRPVLALKPGALLVAPDNPAHILTLSEIEQIDLKGDVKIGTLRIQTAKQKIEVDCAPFDQDQLAAFYAELREKVP